MKIILISKIKNLGNIGDIIDVSNGYARNFLIPTKKAINYSETNYKSFEEKRKSFEAENAKNAKDADKVKVKLAGKNVIIIENASDDGRLYGSVHAGIIAGKINDLIGEKSVSRAHIVLTKTIKEIGIYDATIDLHSDVIIDVRLVIARSDSEVKPLLEKYAKDNSEKAAAKKEEAAKEKAAEKVEPVIEDSTGQEQLESALPAS